MTRQTINTIAKTRGAKIIRKDRNSTAYAFRSDQDVLAFREDIPFRSLWGGCCEYGNTPALTVYFDQLRGY